MEVVVVQMQPLCRSPCSPFVPRVQQELELNGTACSRSSLSCSPCERQQGKLSIAFPALQLINWVTWGNALRVFKLLSSKFENRHRAVGHRGNMYRMPLWWVWWCIPVLTSLHRQLWEDLELKARLGHMARSCSLKLRTTLGNYNYGVVALTL